MDEYSDIIITIVSYMAGAWIAFKIFDHKTKGKQIESKDDRLLWLLLLIFMLGAGSLFSFLLKGWLDME